MNLTHPGNWCIVGRLVVEDGPSLDVFECPACFALTREPMDHLEILLSYITVEVLSSNWYRRYRWRRLNIPWSDSATWWNR